MRKVTAAALSILVLSSLAACGGDDDDGVTEETEAPEEEPSEVELAQLRLEEAQTAVDEADAAFSAAGDAFCTDAADLIQVLDRYGRILDDDSVTVGDVKTGADDLRTARAGAGESADAASDARADLDEANAELASAQAGLADAHAAVPGSEDPSLPPPPETTTVLTRPPIETSFIDRIESTEEELAETVEGIDDGTAVADASVRFGSAAFAVEVAWLQLIVEAGCLDDEQRAAALTVVAEYTLALQTDLQVAGYYTGIPDGVYGIATVDAIEQLQEDAGLPVTGLPDGPTERALDAAVQEKTGAALAGASTHNAAIQGALKALGYWDAPIDGAWSEELVAAIMALQTDLGVEPTGAVDAATLNALEDALAAAEAALTTTTTEPEEPEETPEETPTTEPE